MILHLCCFNPGHFFAQSTLFERGFEFLLRTQHRQQISGGSLELNAFPALGVALRLEIEP